MEHFNSLSYDYYNTFYSYKGYYKKLSLYLLASLFSAFWFACVFLDFTLLTLYDEHIITLENINPLGLEPKDPQNIEDKNSIGLAQKYSITLLFLSEAVFIWFFYKLNKRKENLVKQKLSDDWKVSEKSISDLKQIWLLKTINKKPHEYIPFTESIIKSYDILSEIEQPFDFNRTRFYNMFYEKSAKTRILTFIIALISIFSVMILKTPNSLNVIFAEIYYTPTVTIFTLIALYALLLKCTLFTIEYIALIFIILIDTLSVYFDKPNKHNSHLSKILIRDLIKYSRIELKTPNDIILSN
jgi:hypothetical protein